MTRSGQRLLTVAVNLYGRAFGWVESKWAKSHPPTYRVYTLFKEGINHSLNDFRNFGAARKQLLVGSGLQSLSVAELEAMRRVPRDMVKMAPVLLIAVLPGTFIILPIFYLFPRRLLTSRFWSPEQRIEFHGNDLKKRVVSFDKVNRRLVRNTPAEATLLYATLQEWLLMYNEKKIDLKEPWKNSKNDDIPPDKKIIIGERTTKLPSSLNDATKNQFHAQLTQGQVVSPSQIAQLSSTFRQKPFHMAGLSLLHLEALCKCHACKHFQFFRRSRMETYGKILYHQDRAILREGLASIARPEKEELCLTRGVSPFKWSEEEMDEFLKRWCSTSTALKPDKDMSLILHLPPLLAKNWRSPGHWNQTALEAKATKRPEDKSTRGR